MSNPTRIYHLADAVQWDREKESGYRGSADDLRDGFIHFSTAATVRASAAKHRSGQEGLILLAVHAHNVAETLKWEPARGGILFPHLYGALHPTHVSDSWLIALNTDGLHIFPQEID